ncbi:MAG: hypothetical protein JST00_07610 [Deltaproteobacteria bacterium]|nr:hypothetical protein [Deltaproteobacteria bacterium]
MSQPLHEVLESLPETSLTTRILDALDYLVPGEWSNVVLFEQMVKNVTGESDESLIQAVGEGAIALYANEENGYQRAVQVYKGIDSASTVAGAAALANMAGQRFEILSFLTDVTPKPDTTQAIDAGLKLAGELAAFTLTNGLPGDGVGDFAGALAAYGKEEKMRLAAWLAIDCVLPLGPDFIQKILDAFDGPLESIQNSRVYQFVSTHLPGGVAEHRDTFKRNIEQSRGHLEAMVGQHGLTQETVLARVREYVEIADDKLDVVAAALDMSTNVFEHTGIQTVARRVITRAHQEL